jgi:hypothetical protein
MVDRESHAVEALGADLKKIITCNELRFPVSPELLCGISPNKLLKTRFNLGGRPEQ